VERSIDSLVLVIVETSPIDLMLDVTDLIAMYVAVCDYSDIIIICIIDHGLIIIY
jgi:hypothetical protein